MDNTTEVVTLTAAQYFLMRKKDMERYIEGEHKWYGDVDQSTLMQSVSYNNDTIPWYMK